MIRQPWIQILLALLLLVSVASNFALYRFAEGRYRETRRVRLDPTSENRFTAEDASLPAPAPGIARIVFFGDSRIAQWRDLPDVPDAQLVNRGIGGETTGQLWLRLERDVIALEPDIVVIQAGVNDLTSIGALPREADQITETCRANLDRIMDRLHQAGVRVVLLSVLPAGDVPWSRRPVWSERTRDAIEEVNRALRSADHADTGSVVVDCDPTMAEGQSMRRAYQYDTLHLNASGYEALNALLEPVLARLVREVESPD